MFYGMVECVRIRIAAVYLFVYRSATPRTMSAFSAHYGPALVKKEVILKYSEK